MEATKSAAPAPRRSASVALDFLMLAGASIIAGLVTAAVAAVLVIMLSGPSDAAADAPEAPAPGTAAAAATS
jgi:hypothetical protein